MPNVAYMFQPESYGRGTIISFKDELLTKMFVVEEGDIGIVPSGSIQHQNRRLTNLQAVDYVGY